MRCVPSAKEAYPQRIVADKPDAELRSRAQAVGGEGGDLFGLVIVGGLLEEVHEAVGI